MALSPGDRRMEGLMASRQFAGLRTFLNEGMAVTEVVRKLSVILPPYNDHSTNCLYSFGSHM